MMLTKKEQRLRRSRQTRIRIATQGVARLTVNRTNLHIYATVISGDGAKVLATASTAEAEVRSSLGADAAKYALPDPPDSEAIFRYEMHSLPAEVGDRIGTSMLFAAWNAAIYVNQVEDERLGEAIANGKYLDATQAVLRKHGGLWFNDEAFVVSRRP